MHSSRMRTGRSLKVCRSLLLGVGVGVVCFLGGVCSRRVSAAGGMSASWGGCLFLGGVCLLGGVCFLGGCLLLWGVSAAGGLSTPRGGVVSQHALRQTPRVDRITDACKNITLAGKYLILMNTDGIYDQIILPKTEKLCETEVSFAVKSMLTCWGNRRQDLVSKLPHLMIYHHVKQRIYISIFGSTSIIFLNN